VNSEPCVTRFADLIDYRFRELDSIHAQQIEQHLFECPYCARRAEFLTGLGKSIAEALARGGIASSASVAAVERARALGCSVRTYSIDPGASVNCTAAPDDEIIAVRLRVDASDLERVDIETEFKSLESDRQSTSVLPDIGYDRSAGEVVYLHTGESVRSLPRSLWVLRLRTWGKQGERVYGPYTMKHTPWAQLGEGA